MLLLVTWFDLPHKYDQLRVISDKLIALTSFLDKHDSMFSRNVIKYIYFYV